MRKDKQLSNQVKEAHTLVEAIMFRVGAERFALPINQVIEVVRLPQIVELAKAPEAVVGVINFRSHIVPIFDLNIILGFTPVPYVLTTPILILRQAGQILGLVVEEVLEVATLQVATNTLKGLSSEAIKGLAMKQDSLVFFLDLERLLSNVDNKMLGKALKAFKQANDGQKEQRNPSRAVAKI